MYIQFVTNDIKGTPGRPPTGQGPIFELRMRMNLTLDQFAELIGVSKRTLIRCEQANTLPQSEAARRALERLAKRYKVEIPK
jgi:DNA-binding transcriptional regulator YiaG